MNLLSPRIIGCIPLLWICGEGALAWPVEPTEEEGSRAELAAASAGSPKPNVELPKHVPAPAGKLTFFADFAAAEKNEMPENEGQYREQEPKSSRVPLYLVNRTAQAVNLPFQDGDAIVRLEYQDPKEGWVRAQPRYASWCGNSYYDRKLQSGQYLVMTGLMERGGTPAKVRFASINRNLVSNESAGWYSPSDLKLAEVDDSARSIPSSLSEVLDPRRESETSPGQYVAAMRLTQSLGGTLYYRKVALEHAKALEEKTGATPEEKSAVQALRKIAEAHWPAERNEAVLRERCLRALTHPASSRQDFGAPEDFPALNWAVLEDLGMYCAYTEVPDWKPVVDLLLKAENPKDGFGLLDNTMLADEFVPESFFEKHLLDDNDATRLTCARVIMRRDRREWLPGLASKLSPTGQIEVLKVLVEPTEPGDSPRHAAQPSEEETRFVRHCMQTQPLETASIISSEGYRYLFFDEATYLALRKFVEGEVDKSSKSREDFRQEQIYKLALAVDLLAKFCGEEDVALLKKLLEYRGYEESETASTGRDGKTVTSLYQTFRVRQAAKAALLALHVPVSDNLVLERVVPKAGP